MPAIEPCSQKAVCPGSFDPVTYSHLDIIKRAASLFDQVIVGVIDHPSPRRPALFTIEERIRLLEMCTGDLANVATAPCRGLVAEFAHAHGAAAIVKGLRAISDFEYEMEMDQLNRRQAPEVQSVYLMASADHSFVRSSGLKELAAFGGRLDEMAPPAVVAALRARTGQRSHPPSIGR
jgi:pantetheine-phosphate adenylyltransferase